MAEIKLKLNKDSTKQFLTTPKGDVITKQDWAVVDDEDKTIHAYLVNRNDLEFEDIKKDKKIVDGFKPNKESKKEIFKEQPIQKEELNEIFKEQPIQKEELNNDKEQPVQKEELNDDKEEY